MIRHLFLHELRDIVRSSKFLWSLAACSVLILLAFVAGARSHRLQLQQHEAALAENLRQMEGLTDWMSVNGHRIFLPPRPLEALVTGISNDVGRTIDMTGRGELQPLDSRYGAAPIFALFRFLDLEFIFQVVLSLFAILFAYDAINGEKERGTLRLIFANPVPRHVYLLGKLSGSFVALAVPLLAPILIGCLLLPLLGVQLTGGEWARLALIVLAGFLYFGVFLCLAMLVSALTQRSSSSFVLLLVLWVLCVLIVPRTAVLMAGRAVDVRSVDEIAHQKNRLRMQLWGEDLGSLSNFRPTQTDDPQAMMAEFNQFMEDSSKERENRLKELRDRLNEERRNGQERQARVAFGLARLSPSAALTFATTRLADTSIGLREQFLREALSYQGTFGKFMVEKTGMNLGGHVIMMRMSHGDDEDEEEAIDPRELPVFEYRAVDLRAACAAALPDLGLLAGEMVVLFLGAFVAFLRYDVR